MLLLLLFFFLFFFCASLGTLNIMFLSLSGARKTLLFDNMRACIDLRVLSGCVLCVECFANTCARDTHTHTQHGIDEERQSERNETYVLNTRCAFNR